MMFALHGRAEIALRSLSDGDRRRVSSAMDRLRDIPPNGLARVPEIKRMSSGLYTYNTGDAIRIVFSVNATGLLIEDIAPTTRFKEIA